MVLGTRYGGREADFNTDWADVNAGSATLALPGQCCWNSTYELGETQEDENGLY